MKWLKKIFGNWWVLSILIAVVAALILTLVLPLLAHVLAPLIWRLALLSLVVVIWAIFAALRLFAHRQASDRIANALAKEQAQTASESAVVGQRMAEALSQLKGARGNRRDYLYSRPWYMIIGPPGAGKTTAILNSGLRFPFAQGSVKGVGGTRNLDFWFADEAVVVDTAGRYTSQDSSAAEDREGWIRFLDLLRKHRPLQPINGAIVAIGVDTLLTADVAEIDRHADMIRRRLVELREGLEVSVPVYVVFTKADLMAGFTEFYDDLDVEQRRSVLGTTFDVGEPPPDSTRIAAAFDEVAEAVADREAKRLQDELDTRRRGLILGFPSQIAGLRNAVTRLLEGAFPSAAREGPARLRGFYFASGVQQGAPLDRLMGATAAVFDAPVQVGRTGRAYFLNRLLMEVIFGEAGLVEGTKRVKARRAAILTGGLVATAVIFAVILVAWIASFMGAMSYQKAVQTQAVAAAAALQPFNLAEVNEGDPGLEDALPGLDALRNLPGGYEARLHSGPRLFAWMGIDDAGLRRETQETYLQILQRIMLPRLLLRMERYMRDQLVAGTSDQAGGQLYAPLKAYLILGGRKPGGFDPGSVKRWVTTDWATEVLPGGDRQTKRDSLTKHLDAMLADKGLGSVWGGPAPLDQALITQAQNRLASVPIGVRVYALLKDRAANPAADWKLPLDDSKLAAFANPGDLRSLTVPYLFTRDGYVKAYQPMLMQVAGDMRDDAWVLGPAGDLNGLGGGVTEAQQMYASEYIADWQAVLKTARPADYFSDPAARDAMLVTPSPLRLFLQAVQDQTYLTGALPAVKLRLPGQLSGLASSVQLPTGPKDADAGTQITQAFDDVAQYLKSGAVDKLLDSLRMAVASDTVVSGASSLDNTGSPATAATASLKAATMGAPDAVRNFVESIGKRADAASVGASVDALRNAYANTIKGQCDQATHGFPFEVDSSTDASRDQVVQLFGQGGQMDSLAANLQPHLEDPNAATWRWKADDPAALDPEGAERLQQAQAIKDILKPDGLQLNITAVDFGPGVTSASLKIGDTVNVFTAGRGDSFPYRWSTSSNGVAELTFAGQPVPYSEQGDWALLRLFHLARKVTVLSGSGGSSSLKVQFGGAAAYVTFKIDLPPGVRSPFVDAANSPWSFRCPSRL
jgi:type VI secretion system protein ImpL